MEQLALAAALLLAFANGANDNAKGVATLYGSGALSYPRALGLATASTALGSLASLALAGALVKAFSAKGLVPDAALTPSFLAAVGLAACATVLSATRLGFPISTTHALVGALAGAGFVAAGDGLRLGALGVSFFLPLALGPLLALPLTWGFARAGAQQARALGIGVGDCVCVSREAAPVSLPVAGGVAAAPQLTLITGSRAECDRHGAFDLARALHAGHLLSASAVGFARGLNDTPKILGLVVGLGVMPPQLGALAIAGAMALGGALFARRVADTLAKRITPMTPAEGLAGNLATSLLVIGASRLGLPVSTTHVAAGGIFGIGAASGGLARATALQVALAWLVTLPAAALFGALAQLALH